MTSPLGSCPILVHLIGNHIGEFCESDPKNFDGLAKTFMCLKVLMDISKPIVRKMKIKIDGGCWSWIQSKYERLLTMVLWVIKKNSV